MIKMAGLPKEMLWPDSYKVFYSAGNGFQQQSFGNDG